MICLDTKVVIYVLNRRIPHLRQKLDELLRAGMTVGLPVVALYELRYGYARSARRVYSEGLLPSFLAGGIKVLHFDEEDASHAGDIRAQLEAKGTPIGPYDYLAAQARRRGAALVTLNRREFDRVPGLIMTDWAG